MAAPAEQVHFITLHLRSRHLIPLRPSSQIGIKKENWGPLEQPLEVPPGTGAIEVEEDHTTLPVLRIPLKDLRKLLDNLDWLKHLSRIISGVRNGSLAKLDPPPSTNPVIPDGAELPEESTDYVWEPNILMQNQRCMFLMRIFVGNRGKVVKKDQVSVAKVSNLAESSFSGSVTRRDRSQCKISAFKRGEGYCNTSSHLIPKVLGPVATLSIVVRLGAQISFLELEGDEKPGTVAEDEKPRHEQGDLGWKTPYRQWQHDPRVGVLLHAEFNTLVDRFKMGFYRDQPVEEQDSEFHVHQFDFPLRAEDQNPNQSKGWTTSSLRWESLIELGIYQVPISGNVMKRLNLHGSTVRFPQQAEIVNKTKKGDNKKNNNSNNANTNNANNANENTEENKAEPVAYPTYEVLSWHYAQCVVRKWGTGDYKKFNNVEW